MFLNKKDNLITFIKYLRKHIQDESFENMDVLRDRVINLRNRTYVNEEFDLGMNVFKFDDGFKIEITNEELYFVINVLFFEIDLMNQDTEVEIKKEKNIWHFDSDLAQYFPNGKIMRCLTIMNHFRPKLLELLSSFKGIEYYSAYCYDTKNALKEMCTAIEHIYDSNRYYYKFDNGLVIILNDQEIENISNILTDSF